MKKLIAICAVVAMVLVVSGVAQADVFVNGGDRLIEMQNADGGWGWELTGTSATNSAGPCGPGLLSAYAATNDAKYLTAAELAGDFVITRPCDTYTYRPSVGTFMKMLSDVTGDSKYVDAVKTNYYDTLQAGTFEYKGTTYNTDSYIAYINTARTGQGYPNLAIWDIGNLAAGMATVGVVQTELDKLATAIETGLNTWDQDESYSGLGIAGGVYALATMGRDLSLPIAAENDISGKQTLIELADVLIGGQAPSGGFGEYFYYPVDGYEGVQETAFAIKALQAVDAVRYASEIAAAQNWLVDVQLSTGGWSGEWAGGDITTENNQVTGQALWAVPEPSTFALLGFGALSLLLIRRRRKA